MTKAPKKTVWILGSGFSRSLGGPLLEDLLSTESREDLRTWPGIVATEDTLDELLYGVYHFGNHGSGRRIWKHAEEFLETLDLAASSPDSLASHRIRRLMDKVLNDSFHFSEADELTSTTPGDRVGSLRASARQRIAAQCEGFVREMDVSSERATPYRRWCRMLDETDVILTFNYDRVLEVISRANEDERGLKPEGVVCGEYDRQLAGRLGTPRVYKLHGSVDWVYQPSAVGQPEDGKVKFPFAQLDDAFAKHADDLVLGTPGPTKRLVTTDWLSELWHTALAHVRGATAIVFVGYRFPPSDAHARESILRALAENKMRRIAAHVVLGPGSSDDATRLVEMTRAVLRGSARVENADRAVGRDDRWFTITRHRMLAEDFFTVYERSLLFRPDSSD